MAVRLDRSSQWESQWVCLKVTRENTLDTLSPFRFKIHHEMEYLSQYISSLHYGFLDKSAVLYLFCDKNFKSIFGGVLLNQRNNNFVIEMIETHEKFRGKGVGKAMIAYIAKDKEVTEFSGYAMENARSFWISLGVNPGCFSGSKNDKDFGRFTIDIEPCEVTV